MSPAAPSSAPGPVAIPDREPTTSVSVILPTYNEAENIGAAIAATQAALDAYPDHEILVVDDDSPDGTWRLVADLSEADPRIRSYRRVDQRGLASAIVDGLAMARGEALVVMDADLQHDPAVIPRLLDALEEAEVAVASRYSGGGLTGTWGQARRWASSLATSLCRWALGLTVSDPMSGFFAIRRGSFQRIADQLRPRGFKALMEILYRLRGAPVAEVPFTFGRRLSGTSKLGRGIIVDYLLALIELRFGRGGR